MIKQHVSITSEITHNELTNIINNWQAYQVATVLKSYQEISRRTLQAPSLLRVLVEIKLQKNLTEFCQENQFSKIEDFLESFKTVQKNKVKTKNKNSPDGYGLYWV
jgi:hypothetical protein